MLKLLKEGCKMKFVILNSIKDDKAFSLSELNRMKSVISDLREEVAIWQKAVKQCRQDVENEWKLALHEQITRAEKAEAENTRYRTALNILAVYEGGNTFEECINNMHQIAKKSIKEI